MRIARDGATSPVRTRGNATVCRFAWQQFLHCALSAAVCLGESAIAPRFHAVDLWFKGVIRKVRRDHGCFWRVFRGAFPLSTLRRSVIRHLEPRRKSCFPALLSVPQEFCFTYGATRALFFNALPISGQLITQSAIVPIPRIPQAQFDFVTPLFTCACGSEFFLLTCNSRYM